MGWFGYGLYDGDGTMTCHLDFIKWAIPSLKHDIIYEMMEINGTSIPDDLMSSFKKGIPNILKKMKTPKRWDEDIAIEWQMLLALFVDNDLKVPHEVLVNGMLASHYLLGEHAEDFDEPAKRKAVIKRFMKKVDKNFCSVKARKEIEKLKKVAI